MLGGDSRSITLDDDDVTKLSFDWFGCRGENATEETNRSIWVSNLIHDVLPRILTAIGKWVEGKSFRS